MIYLGGSNLRFTPEAAKKMEEELRKRGLFVKISVLEEKEPSSAVRDILAMIEEKEN